MKALYRFVVWFEETVCIVLFLAMTALGGANIVARYFTDSALGVSEELILAGFLCLTVFGAAIAARRGEHLAVTVFVDGMPVSWQRRIFWLAYACSAGAILFSAWYAVMLVRNEFASGLRTYGLGLPAWYYHFTLPLGFLLVFLEWSVRAFREWKRLAVHDG